MSTLLIKIEKTKSGKYVLKIENREIALDDESLEKLRVEAQKIHFRPALLQALEWQGFDAGKIESDEALIDKLCAEFISAAEHDNDRSRREIDASRIAYDIARSHRGDLEGYRTIRNPGGWSET